MSVTSRSLLRMFLAGLPLVSVAAACVHEDAAATSESKILNGTTSNRPDVVLLASEEDRVSCSGTLIAPDVVLTAAHCLEAIEWAYFGYSHAAADGKIDPATAAEARRYRIVDRVSVPGWVEKGCPMQGIDVALVRLESEVEGIAPAKLADRPAEIGEECIVSGFGKHKIDEDLDDVEGDWGDYTTGEQRQARVIVQPQPSGGDAGDAGDAGPANKDEARDDVIRAKGVDGAHSRGDSGGPLFCAGRVTGVVSCSVDRYKPILELEKVYARVDAARAFIDETQEKWRQRPLALSDAGAADAAPAASDAGAAPDGG